MANKNFVVPFMGDGTCWIKADETIITEPATENTAASKEPTTQPVTGATAAGTTTQGITESSGDISECPNKIELSNVFVERSLCSGGTEKKNKSVN